VRWLVLCVLVLGGCRQLLGIDDPSVAGAGDGGPDGTFNGHDEDGDGVADLIDNCPSVPNTDQRLGDAKLGEACDPRPTTIGDRIAMFVPFYPMGPVAGLQVDSNAVFEIDHVRIMGQQLQTMADFLPTRISVRVQLLAFLPPSAALSIEIGQHKCSIEGCSGSGNLCLVARTSGVTSETDLPFTVPDMLEMNQSAGELICNVGAIEAKATALASQQNRIKVRTLSATVQIEALTIYDAGTD
jgi:hypothetical protein